MDELDTKGEWQPRIIPLVPLYNWPPQLMAALKWLFGYPGVLIHWTAIFMLIPLVKWFFLTLDLARMKTFETDCITAVFIRNIGLLP